MAAPATARPLFAEALGTALLVAAVVGSGIAASRLSSGDVGVQLFESAAARPAPWWRSSWPSVPSRVPTSTPIAPESVPLFVAAHLPGGALASLAVRTLYPRIADVPADVAVPHDQADDHEREVGLLAELVPGRAGERA